MSHSRSSLWLALAGAMFAAPLTSAAQPYVYPARGQSAQQQEFDRGQCYSWAVQQTGFDPANPRVATGPPPMPTAPWAGCSAASGDTDGPKRSSSR